MKIKVKGKRIIIFIICLIAIIPFLIFYIRELSIGNDKNAKYAEEIYIKMVDKDGKEKEYIINIKKDKDVLLADTSYMNTPIYITKKGVFYKYGNRYRKIERERNYSDVYGILQELGNNPKNGYLNLQMSSEKINNLLDSMFIDLKINREVTTNVKIEDDLVQEFRLYLKDILNYDSIDIQISIKKVNDDLKIECPIFYKEATDTVDDKQLLIPKY